jgi:hypothetical protein
LQAIITDFLLFLPSHNRVLAFPHGFLHGALASLFDSRLAGGIDQPDRQFDSGLRGAGQQYRFRTVLR